MIKNISISASKFEVTDDLERYINKKIGKLDKYISKNDKAEVRADVKMQETVSKKNGKTCTCEVIMHINGNTHIVKESTMNMFAAIDIVEAKLKNLLKKDKEKHSKSNDKHKNRQARKVLGKFFSR